MTDTWYSYECRSGCSQFSGGVIVDARLPGDSDREPPEVKCPLCGSSLDFRGKWAATEAGYGSSGNSPPLVVFPRFFEDLAATMASNLLNVRLIPTPQYDTTVALLTRQLMFQLNLHHSWRDGDEVTSVRIRMDQP